MRNLLFLVLILSLFCYSCEDKNGGDGNQPSLDPVPDKPEVLVPSPVLLANTKWKLSGIFNEMTGILTELEPKNCDECYTLTFDTDSTFTTHSSVNTFRGNYIVDYEHGGLLSTRMIPFTLWIAVINVFVN